MITIQDFQDKEIAGVRCLGYLNDDLNISLYRSFNGMVFEIYIGGDLKAKVNEIESTEKALSLINAILDPEFLI